MSIPMTTPPSSDSDDHDLDATKDRPATSRARPTPPGMWQPPSLEDMQGMLPQYQFECLLGHGGMGAVFKAVQVSLDRAVAIKVLPGDLLGDTDAQFMERFKNEARTMAKMNHPAIVDVHDFGVTQTGLLYFVMEFIDGTDVSKMIIASGRLPPEHALAITAHVCDALHYAHTHGVIHRDIKPANVLINMEGQVKVADFGLAKASDPNHIGLTRTNMAMGTPDFVAPEAVINGIQLDGRADIYAVGVMLYQMLTGNIPRGMWVMPSVMVQTDPRFDAIIARAMQVDREARYQSAMDLRRELDVILTVPYVKHDDRHSSAAIPKQQLALAHQGRRQQVVAHRPPQHSARLPQRQPARVVTYAPQKKGSGLLGMVAAVIVGGAGFYYFQRMQKPAAPPPEAPAASIASAAIKVADYDATSEAQPKPVTSNAPAVPPAAAQPPPTGVISFGGHRYQFVPDKTLTWTQAKAAAEKMGGHLATITSKEENDWIASTVIAKLERGLGSWIGGTNEGSLWKWRWITGEPFTFTAWGQSEPQNTANEPAILFSYSDSGTLTWADIKDDATTTRDRRAGYLVEWDQDTAPVLADSVAAVPPVDLLATVDVKRDAVKGTWELKPDGIRTQGSSGSQLLEFNHTAPEEYDFEIEFTTSGGTREVVQVLPIPGRFILWKMCPSTSDPATYLFGPSFNGQGATSSSATEARTQLPRLKVAHRYRSLVEVRKGSLRAVLDGQEIVKWSGDFARLSTGSEASIWSLKNPQHLGIAAFTTDVTFHKAELRPKNIVSIRLAQFESQFKEAWERDVARSTAGKAIVALDTQYLAALDRVLADATKAGSLDDVTALNAEKKRIADKQPLPAADPTGTTASLGKLRATYRKTSAPLFKQRDAVADPVYARYDAALAAFETELSQASATADAKLVKAKRDEIAVLRDPGKADAVVASAPTSAPPSTAPSTASKSAPTTLTADILNATPPKPFTPEEAIHWALTLKGSAKVMRGKTEVEVVSIDTIPKAKYILVGLKIGEDQPLQVVSLAGLAQLAELRELTLSRNKITDAGLAFLPPLPKLDSLSINSCGLTDAAFAHLAKQPALTQLSVSGNNITGTGLSQLPSAARLTSLSIGSSKLSDEGISSIARCAALRSLGLSSGAPLACTSLAPLAVVTTLRSLSLSDKAATDALVQSLSVVTQLTALDVSYSAITDFALDRINALTLLSDINLYGCKEITDSGFLKLLPLGKSVKRLFPGGTRLSDAGFKALTDKLTEITEIDLANTGVSPAGLAGLGNLRKLASLSVHARHCTDEGLKHLARATNSLNLKQFGIRDQETLSTDRMAVVRASLTRWTF